MEKSEKVSLTEGNITTDTEKWTEKTDKLFIPNRELSWVTYPWWKDLKC